MRVSHSQCCRLLCEVHEEYETNIKLAKEGYFVYDFALPLLLLHAFTFHTAENIANWLRICPRRQITVLDTHDGMGIDDISGLASVSATLQPTPSGEQQLCVGYHLVPLGEVMLELLLFLLLKLCLLAKHLLMSETSCI